LTDTIFEKKDTVAVITLNRPDKLNSVKLEQLKELIVRLNEYEQDDGIRSIILTAQGRGFCTGADLAGGGGRPDAGTPMGMKLSTLRNRLYPDAGSYATPISGFLLQ